MDSGSRTVAVHTCVRDRGPPGIGGPDRADQRSRRDAAGAAGPQVNAEGVACPDRMCETCDSWNPTAAPSDLNKAGRTAVRQWSNSGPCESR
ncbi:hypothetical protein NDU88_005261 [Pleurodeles waltl]|uniref:Uncharacterized protein n=1 Tax=Pleurodeles waltl TaxID=8319 RepID=A0AAV7NM79_PLEWA|nr:hypothetical protein NDU88_005261 [Pleurodeles waltl]